MPITPFWGEVAGIKIYLEKTLVALIHELFSLIRKSKNVIESSSFKEIYRLLHKNSRNSWRTILKYSFGEADSKTELGKALLMVRHKIANHYDKDEIYKGYQRKFLESKNIPFISRGNSMIEKRFYFADASAQEYYISFQEKVSNDEFYANLNLIKDFNLENLLHKTIASRFMSIYNSDNVITITDSLKKKPKKSKKRRKLL